MGEWVMKIWYIHIREYYLAFEKEGNSGEAVAWKGVEDVMLSVMSQPQKDKYSMIPLR